MTFMFVRNAALFASLSILSVVIWMWTVPAVMFGSTFVAVLVFLLGAAAVSLTTWRNGQATRSTAQLLHSTDANGANVAPRTTFEKIDAA